MKIKKSQIRRIIAENLLLEAASPLKAEVVFQQLLRGDAAFKGQKLAGITTTFIKSCVSRGIIGSTGTVYRGGDAVAYLVHRILPRVYASNLGSASSATAVKNSLRVIKMFASEYNILPQLVNYRVVDGPSYVGKLLNTKMGQQILNTMPKAAQATKTAVQAAKSAGALTKPAAQVTNAIVNVSKAPPVKTAAKAIKVTLNSSPEALALAKKIGKDAARSGQNLNRVSQAIKLAAKELAEEASKVGGKFGKFFRRLGAAATIFTVLDAAYQPYNLAENGEFFGFKVGLGLKDIKTPWGQLTYQRKMRKRPIKPEDFNPEYRNVIAALIWNQRNAGETGQIAKEWTQRAIKEDLLDLPKWKAYLAPWREAAATVKEAELELDKEDSSEGSEDIRPLGVVNEEALAALGEDTGENLSDVGSDRTRTSIPVNDKVKEIQQIIKAPSSNDGQNLGDGQWGTKTTVAWKNWVVKPETIEAMKALKAKKESKNESFSRVDLRNLYERIMGENGLLNENEDDVSDNFEDFIQNNAGDASKIADYVGFGPKLSGVYALATAVAEKQSQDEDPQTRQDTDEDTSEESNEPPKSEEKFQLSDLKLSIERFKDRNGSLRTVGDRNMRVVSIEKPPNAIVQGGGASENKKLKNYRNLKLTSDKKHIVISPKPLRGNTFKRYKLGPVKIEGDYVVSDKTANESLSHGALIRRRYRRY